MKGGGRRGAAGRPAPPRGSGVDRLPLLAGFDADLAWLRALAHRDDHREHAALVRGADAVEVDALAERELAEERSGAAFTGEPPHALAGVGGALRAQGELGAVEVDVDRPRVDARQIGVQDVAVAVAV